jgi:hypothetical protein
MEEACTVLCCSGTIDYSKPDILDSNKGGQNSRRKPHRTVKSNQLVTG